LVEKQINNLKDLSAKLSEINTQLQNPPKLDELITEIDKLIGKLENDFANNGDTSSYTKLLDNLDDLKNETGHAVMGKIMGLLGSKADSVMNDVSCKVLPTVYKTVVNVGCHEYVDNFNAFWFYLILVVLINVLVAILAAKESNLLRKNYGYEDIMSEDL
jgi:hypothetical protein